MLRSIGGFLSFGVFVIGGAWAMYCMTPAGAAEREQTRRQKEIAQQYANTSNVPKRNTN